MDIIIDPNCSRNMNPDVTLYSSSGPDIIKTPVAAQATQISMALRHQHGPRRQPRLLALPGPSMVSRTIGIDTDISFCMATDPGMVLRSIPGLDNTMAGPMWQYRSSRSAWLWWQQGPWTILVRECFLKMFSFKSNLNTS